jgi:hypothetical protein
MKKERYFTWRRSGGGGVGGRVERGRVEEKRRKEGGKETDALSTKDKLARMALDDGSKTFFSIPKTVTGPFPMETCRHRYAAMNAPARQTACRDRDPRRDASTCALRPSLHLLSGLRFGVSPSQDGWR